MALHRSPELRAVFRGVVWREGEIGREGAKKEACFSPNMYYGWTPVRMCMSYEASQLLFTTLHDDDDVNDDDIDSLLLSTLWSVVVSVVRWCLFRWSVRAVRWSSVSTRTGCVVFSVCASFRTRRRRRRRLHRRQSTPTT